MPLVSSLPLLRDAMAECYALGAFNFWNLEMAQAIVEAAEDEGAPAILQVNPAGIRYGGLAPLAAIGVAVAQAAKVPVALHLDHGTGIALATQCLRLGFTSIMFDGSGEAFEKNTAQTRLICEMGHAVDVPVEGELGAIGGREEGAASGVVLTDPDEARRFVELTGVDALAIAVGSAHGMQRQEAELDVERISRIKERTRVPLVLHGASGVPDEGVREAVSRGIAKINVSTYINTRFLRGTAAAMAASPGENDPKPLLLAGKAAAKEAVREKLRLLGSSGRAK